MIDGTALDAFLNARNAQNSEKYNIVDYTKLFGLLECRF